MLPSLDHCGSLEPDLCGRFQAITPQGAPPEILPPYSPLQAQQLYPTELSPAFGASVFGAMDLITDASLALAVEILAARGAGLYNADAPPEPTSSEASLNAQSQPSQPVVDVPVEVPADLTGLGDQPFVGIIDTGFSPDVLALDSIVFLGRDRIDNDSNPIVLDTEGTENAPALENQPPENLTLDTAPPEIEIPGNTVSEAELAFQVAQIIADADGFEPLWLGRADGLERWAASLIEFVDISLALGFNRAVVSLNVDLTEVVLPEMELPLLPGAVEPAPEGDEFLAPRSQLTDFEQAALNYARQNNVLIVLPAGDMVLPADDTVLPAGDMVLPADDTITPLSPPSGLVEATQPFDNVVAVGVAATDGVAPEISLDYGDGVDLLAPGEPLAPSSPDSALSASLDAAADTDTGSDMGSDPVGLGAIAAELAPFELAPLGSTTPENTALVDLTDDGITANLVDLPLSPPSTTLAAARVTSAIAQIWTANADLNYLQVVDTLLTTATPSTEPVTEPVIDPTMGPDDGAEPDDGQGANPGVLNLDAALEVALLLEGEEYVPAPLIAATSDETPISEPTVTESPVT